MKLTMTRVLTPLAALAIAFGAQATDFAKDDFEGSWSNATGGYRYVTTNGTTDATAQYTYNGDAPSSAISPIGGATNLKGLKLSTEDGTLFRDLTDASVGASGLYVDTDVQFTLTDSTDRPQVTYDSGNPVDKFIIWLEANETAHTTNLCVYGGSYTYTVGATPVIARGDPAVYTLSGVDIAPGSWHRLTVKAVANASTVESFTLPGFQVYIDGTPMRAGSGEYFFEGFAGYDDDQDFIAAVGNAGWALISGQQFFPALTETLSSLNSVGFSGEGKIDDLVVTDDIPSSLPRVAVTVNWDDSIVSNVTVLANGASKTLASSGSLLTLEPGTTASFTMANLTAMPGVNLSSYDFKAIGDDWSLSGVATLTVNEGTVTVGGSNSGVGAFTIALERSSSAKVTINWTNVADPIDNIASITYTLSGESAVVISSEEAIDAGYAEIDAELDQTITVVVTLAQGVSGIVGINGTAGVSGTAPTFTVADNAATIAITLTEPAATVNGTPYPTFAAALAAAKTTGEPLVLCSDITLDAAQAIASGETVTIDLAGYTITGADDVAAFSNAGTLTITDSSQDHDGSVVAGNNGYVVDNDGTLALVYGSYEGEFANSGTFTITTDCAFDNNLSGAYTAAAGYQLAETGSGTGVYKLSILTYTITYMNGAGELTGLTPTSYTVTNNVTLPSEVDLGVVGVGFDGWTNATGTVVTGWDAGDLTENQVFYAKTAVVTAGTEPGATAGTYADATAATNAAAGAIVAVPAAVAAELTSAQQEEYKKLFAGKVVAIDGGADPYAVVIELKPAVAEDLQEDANEAATNVLANLSTRSVTVEAKPGLYYSIKSGTTLNNMTEGARTMATSDTVNLAIPGLGTTGFYQVLINITDKPQN